MQTAIFIYGMDLFGIAQDKLLALPALLVRKVILALLVLQVIQAQQEPLERQVQLALTVLLLLHHQLHTIALLKL